VRLVRSVRSWLSRMARRAGALWQRALSERSSPGEIGWSIGIGVLAGCTPLIGLHMWIALALATLLRKNRLWAFVGSRVSSNVLLVFIVFAEIELAHRVRVGAWAPLAPHDALARSKELLLDWFLGSALVGPALACVLGGAAYAAVRRWPRLTQRTRSEAPPRSSGSPPSGRPAPTP
jgi:uncharacterized protein (DUF2062 family)